MFAGVTMKKRYLLAVPCALVLFACVEAVARFGLGLGTPPLSVAHPKIEYMFAPDQDLQRFGNRQLYNELGMRSPGLDEVSAPRRVLVMGDSVVNGGSLTDHAMLATTLLSDDQVFFGNVSAGSWGPANLAAWLGELGHQGADTAVIVLSSHDFGDIPNFEALDPNTHPTRAPILAIQELITRYLPRFIPSFLTAPVAEDQLEETLPEVGRDGVRRLLDALANAGLKVCLVQHLTETELSSTPESGWAEIGRMFQARTYPIVQLSERIAREQAAGRSPFRDDIHLNDLGQATLAEAVKDCDSRAKLEG
jgi:hypothetical protein